MINVNNNDLLVLAIGPCITIRPANPPGAKATMTEKVTPRYNNQASVISSSTESKYVKPMAPITGPKKCPTPPINAINKTCPDCTILTDSNPMCS